MLWRSSVLLHTPPSFKARWYTWHATQEHWGFGQGTTFSIVMIAVLIVIALISFCKCNHPGARSSTYVLLDAF